jgi:hypothetical protein
MGSGVSSGEGRAIDAATKAISSRCSRIFPSAERRHTYQYHRRSEPDTHEVNEASHLIQEEATKRPISYSVPLSTSR